MKVFDKEKQSGGVHGWWKSDNILKWDRKYDDYDCHTMKYLNSRQQKILSLVDQLQLPKDARVLELAYGAGQTAVKLAKRGFEVHGVDISDKLCDVARERCARECPEGKVFLKTGSIESKLDYEDGSFDLVVLVGALQYLYAPEACLKEVRRVLKPGGYFVIGQRNTYCISVLSSLREIIRCLVYLTCREKHETFSSYKSILTDSKLGKFFGKYKNSKFMNSKFMLKGHDTYKYELKKNIYSYFSLKSFLKREGFRLIKGDGVYFPFSEKKRFFEFNMKYDAFLEKYVHGLLFPFGRTAIFLTQNGSGAQI